MFLILILLVVLVIWLIATFNGLVASRNRVDNAWAQIDTQLQRRFDLIPNLVETAKGYAAHEKELFEAIARSKEGLVHAQSVSEKGEASTELSKSVSGLLALGEAYPELQANQNFLELQRELKGTEDKIAFARQFYNDSVTRYNTKIDMFPTNIFANSMNMVKREYFALENAAARGPVQVKF